MTKADERFNIHLKTVVSGKPPVRTPMPAERETPNPAPDAEHPRTLPPFTDDEENDPEIEGE